jgi:hypothetical protein
MVLAFSSSGCGSIPELRFVDDNELDGGKLPDGAVNPAKCDGGGPEVCDDGIDNDCDGKVDCQDSDCTPTYSCQDAPADWTAVAFAAATRPACSALATATDLAVSAGDGTAVCNCTCRSNGGACTAGSFSLTISNENTCGTVVATRAVPLSGACSALATPFQVPSNAFVKISPPAGPASCDPVSPLNGPLTNGRICQAAKFGKGCSTGQVCAPKPTVGTTVCVTKPGANACPTGFGKRSTAGTTANDQRTCTGCTCAPPTPCAGGSVSVYDGNMCKTAGANKGATGIGTTCAAASSDDFSATHFDATPPTGGCSATPLTMAVAGPGALSFADTRTVCCK